MPAGLPGTKHGTVDVTTLDYEAVPGATIAAVLVHPHPDMGGDRFNHVVDAIYRALPPAGLSVARFDLSSSDPDQAHADTVLAIDMIGAPRVAIVGYSFGADVALGVADTRIAGWFAVAPPLRFVDFEAIATDARPKVLLVPEHDQFSPPERVNELTSGWANARVTSLSGADHFLNGHSRAVAEAVRAWVAGLATGADQADQTDQMRVSRRRLRPPAGRGRPTGQPVGADTKLRRTWRRGLSTLKSTRTKRLPGSQRGPTGEHRDGDRGADQGGQQWSAPWPVEPWACR